MWQTKFPHLPLSMLGYLKVLFSAPQLFIFYVNDITQCATSNINLFADDTSSYLLDNKAERLTQRLQTAVNHLSS